MDNSNVSLALNGIRFAIRSTPNRRFPNTGAVGRGSQFILPREFGLFVRLRAPLEHRVARIAKLKGLSDKEAKEYVNKTEQERTKFLKSYFDSDGFDADLYDLTIDTSRFEPEAVAELIEAAMKLRTTEKRSLS